MAQIPDKTIVGKGRPEDVFERATAGSGSQFGIECDSGNYMGVMILEAVGMIGAGPGTITALVVDLEISLDGGVTFKKLVTAITLTTNAASVNVAGLGAGALLRLTSTTFTLGTATSIIIWALTG